MTTDEKKQKQIVIFNDFINNRIRRYQKLSEYLQRALDRSMIIYDNQAKPGDVSTRLYELVIEHNKNIAYVFGPQDYPMFIEIKDYLFNSLDCPQFVQNKTEPILFINSDDEPILGFF